MKKPPTAWLLRPSGANSTGTPAQPPSAVRSGDAQKLFFAINQFLCAVSGPIPWEPGNLLQYGVLERLRRAQANYGLGLDLDGFARLRVTAHARLAVRFHGAADVRNNELARTALAFLNREFKELFEKERRGFLGCGALLGDVRHDLALAHWLGCHLVCLSSCIYFPPRTSGAGRERKTPVLLRINS